MTGERETLFADAHEAAAWLRSYSNGVLKQHAAAADLLDALADENAEYEVCANLMLDALLLIRDEAGKPLGIWDAVKDQGWCAGVAMSAVAALGERAAAWKRKQSHVPKFLPKWLGGETDRVSGPGCEL